MSTDDDVRFVWRHLPLTDVHPQAQLAAEASEAAAEQDAFWPMQAARTRAALGGRTQAQSDVRVRTRSRRGFL